MYASDINGISGINHTALHSPLRFTMPVAVALHALFIFGISFVPGIVPKLNVAPVLDITLVQTHADETPDDVKFIAQANQEASGTTDEENRPRSPSASLQWQPLTGDAPVASQESAPDSPPRLQPQLLTTKGETFKHIAKTPEQPEREELPVDEERSDTTQEIAQLLAEVDEEEARYSRRPKINYLSAVSAKSAVEAAYIDAWVKKIERVGNINFPTEAIYRSLSGRLILNVTLDHAGRVVEANIDVSSGYSVLDSAAARIVEIAAPYPQLPKEIREKWDQLNITRTWVFHSGTLNTE